MSTPPVRSSRPNDTVPEGSGADCILDVEQPFRVEAGPGAGKTRWLVEHIKRTLRCGARLNGRSRVACITYTQIGADEVSARLGLHSERVSVSTIHSFLYHALVRPYACRLKIAALDTAAIYGHGPLRPSVAMGYEFLEAVGVKRQSWHMMPQLAHNLQYAIEWVRDGSCVWRLQFTNSSDWKGIVGVPQPKRTFGDASALGAYKEAHWKDGRIDHDDVIYLSHRLITEHPKLCDGLAARFPYIYLDEYQDTTPVQAEIVDALGRAGVTVGVIGDAAQSIFAFTGAGPEHYNRFNPPNCTRLVLNGNHRSSAPVVHVLNKYRTIDSLTQESLQKAEKALALSPRPCILVGSLADAHFEASRRIDGLELHLMGRGHSQVADLIRVSAGRDARSTPWETLVSADSERAFLLEALCRAVRLRREKQPREAIHALDNLWRSGGRVAKPFKLAGPPLRLLERRVLATLLIEEMQGSVRLNRTVADAYECLRLRLVKEAALVALPKTAGGKFSVAASMSLEALIDTVRVDSSIGLARTIHGFKGDEADAILLYVDRPALLARVHSPDASEETRLLYVALSRARTHVFVAVPGLEPEFDERLEKMGYEVVRLPSGLDRLPSLPGELPLRKDRKVQPRIKRATLS